MSMIIIFLEPLAARPGSYTRSPLFAVPKPRPGGSPMWLTVPVGTSALARHASAAAICRPIIYAVNGWLLGPEKWGSQKGISDTQKRSKGAVFGHFSLMEIFSWALRKVEGESQALHKVEGESQISENFWAVRICSNGLTHPVPIPSEQNGSKSMFLWVAKPKVFQSAQNIRIWGQFRPVNAEMVLVVTMIYSEIIPFANSSYRTLSSQERGHKLPRTHHFLNPPSKHYTEPVRRMREEVAGMNIGTDTELYPWTIPGSDLG
ncbi:hypothetical protein C8J57DRAFT_1230071 [Mycena rebaudengoi]|nr:hypothetical protein C8J57DRAFT_1230071 [Mycena rebaudengoi]